MILISTQLSTRSRNTHGRARKHHLIAKVQLRCIYCYYSERLRLKEINKKTDIVRLVIEKALLRILDPAVVDNKPSQ